MRRYGWLFCFLLITLILSGCTARIPLFDNASSNEAKRPPVDQQDAVSDCSNEPEDESPPQQNAADKNADEPLLDALKAITGEESDSLEKQFFRYYQLHNYELAMMPAFESSSLPNWDDLTLFVLLDNDNRMDVDGTQAMTYETFAQTVTRFFGMTDYSDKSSKYLLFEDGVYTAVPGDTVRSGYFWLKEMNVVSDVYTATFDAFYFNDLDYTSDYDEASQNQRVVRDRVGVRDLLQPSTFASTMLEILENEDYASILDVSETVTVTFSLSSDPKYPLTYTSCSIQKSEH